MRTDHEQVPEFPRITAELVEDMRAEVTINGMEHSVAGADLATTRAAVVALIRETAQKLGRPVRALTVDVQGEWPLIVHEDGVVEKDTSVLGLRHMKSREPKGLTGERTPKRRRPLLGRLAKVSERGGENDPEAEPHRTPGSRAPAEATADTVGVGDQASGGAHEAPRVVRPSGEHTHSDPSAGTKGPGPGRNFGGERGDPRSGSAPATGSGACTEPSPSTPRPFSDVASSPPNEPPPQSVELPSGDTPRKLPLALGTAPEKGGPSPAAGSSPVPVGDRREPGIDRVKPDDPGLEYPVAGLEGPLPPRGAVPEPPKAAPFEPAEQIESPKSARFPVESDTEPGPSASAAPQGCSEPPASPWALGGESGSVNSAYGVETSPVPLARAPEQLAAPSGSSTGGLSRDESVTAWQSAIREHNGLGSLGHVDPVGGAGAPATPPFTADHDGPGRLQGFLRSLWMTRRSRLAEFLREIQAPIPAHRRITVLSLKGGVGKTTVSVLLGSLLASARESRVVALDANLDRGTLRDRVLLQNDRTLQDLSEHVGRVKGYTELRRYVSVNDSRLHTLVSSAVPVTNGGIAGERYLSVTELLGRYYDLLINDCGTGLHQPGMRDVLDLSDQVVIVLEEALDSVRSAESTFLWLTQNGYQDLARRAIVVVSRVDRKSAVPQEIANLENNLNHETSGIVRVPYDEHLAEGGVVRLDRLSEQTRAACRRLALLSVQGLTVLG